MSSTSEVPATLQLRGYIPKDHPLFQLLKGVPPRVAFKTLAALAIEGATAKQSTDQVVAVDHPLSATLRGMTIHNAFLYLVGATRAQLSDMAHRQSTSSPQTGPGENTSGSMAPAAVTPPTPAPALASMGAIPECDEDDLAAMFQVPATV